MQCKWFYLEVVTIEAFSTQAEHCTDVLIVHAESEVGISTDNSFYDIGV